MVAHREEEILCRVVDDETGAEDVDWMAPDEVGHDVPDEAPQEEVAEDGVELIECIPDFLAIPWEIDD